MTVKKKTIPNLKTLKEKNVKKKLVKLKETEYYLLFIP